MNLNEDQKYLTALLENDRVLIEEIYSKYSRLLVAYILKNGGEISDAEDLFQEGLTIIYEKAIKGFILKGSLKDYLMGICKNKWIDKIRSQSKEKEIERILCLQMHTSKVYEKGYDELKYEIVKEKIEELPKHCQKILNHFFNDNPAANSEKNMLQEISDNLGYTYNYAKKAKCNCLKKLITNIKECPKYQQINNLDYTWEAQINQ